MPVFDMVIPPEVLDTDIPVPAVNVAREKPPPNPIKSCPLAGTEFTPVPPLVTSRVPVTPEAGTLVAAIDPVPAVVKKPPVPIVKVAEQKPAVTLEKGTDRVPVIPLAGTLVAAIVTVPVVVREAPLPTTIAADVLVPEVKPEKADPIEELMVTLEPLFDNVMFEPAMRFKALLELFGLPLVANETPLVIVTPDPLFDRPTPEPAIKFNAP
jgi:hypothetical protein